MHFSHVAPGTRAKIAKWRYNTQGDDCTSSGRNLEGGHNRTTRTRVRVRLACPQAKCAKDVGCGRLNVSLNHNKSVTKARLASPFLEIDTHDVPLAERGYSTRSLKSTINQSPGEYCKWPRLIDDRPDPHEPQLNSIPARTAVYTGAQRASTLAYAQCRAGEGTHSSPPAGDQPQAQPPTNTL